MSRPTNPYPGLRSCQKRDVAKALWAGRQRSDGLGQENLLLFLGLEQINEFVHNTGDFILRGRGHSDRLHRAIVTARPSREASPEILRGPC